MSMHWQRLDTDGKIDAIRTVWRDGMSASQIAAHFDGATRGAVVGMYDRWREDLKACPLRPGIKRTVTRYRARRTVAKVIAEAPFVATEQHLAGIPMMMLGAQQCRFAVNDAEIGETHLFCGLPSEGSYCGHHAMRAVRRVA